MKGIWIMEIAWIEFKMYLAEKLLSLAFNISPREHTHGLRLKSHILEYFKSVVKFSMKETLNDQ